MKEHTVDLAAVHGHEGYVSFASAVGEGVNKRLDAKVTFAMEGPTATYIVTSGRQVRYEGGSLAEAVEVYNSI